MLLPPPGNGRAVRGRGEARPSGTRETGWMAPMLPKPGGLDSRSVSGARRSAGPGGRASCTARCHRVGKTSSETGVVWQGVGSIPLQIAQLAKSGLEADFARLSTAVDRGKKPLVRPIAARCRSPPWSIEHGECLALLRAWRPVGPWGASPSGLVRGFPAPSSSPTHARSPRPCVLKDCEPSWPLRDRIVGALTRPLASEATRRNR